MFLKVLPVGICGVFRREILNPKYLLAPKRAVLNRFRSSPATPEKYNHRCVKKFWHNYNRLTLRVINRRGFFNQGRKSD